MKKYILAISILFSFNFSFQTFAENGAATVYKVTIQKIELCTAAPLADKRTLLAQVQQQLELEIKLLMLHL